MALFPWYFLTNSSGVAILFRRLSKEWAWSDEAGPLLEATPPAATSFMSARDILTRIRGDVAEDAEVEEGGGALFLPTAESHLAEESTGKERN